MGIDGANLLQYVMTKGGSSDGGSSAPAQNGQKSWAAGGLFIDANASTEEQVEQVTSAVSNILALFGANEAGAAREETQANENAADELDKTVKNTTDKTNEIVNEQIARIQEIANIIKENLEQVEKDNEEKEKNQEKLKEYLTTIDGCKVILADPNRTSSERTAAIAKLREAGEGITELSAYVKTLQESTKEKSEQVAELGKEQTDINSKVDSTIQDGNSLLAEVATKIITEQAKNVATATKGGVNESVSFTAKALAASTRGATSWIPFASAAAEALALKYDSIANDQGQAGSTRIPSAATTQTKIAASEATRQISLTMFENIYSYAIGQSDEASMISNTFYSFLEPIGAWIEQADGIDSQAEQLNTAIEEVSQKVEEPQQNEQGQDNLAINQEDSSNGQGVTLNFETDELQELLA